MRSRSAGAIRLRTCLLVEKFPGLEKKRPLANRMTGVEASHDDADRVSPSLAWPPVV